MKLYDDLIYRGLIKDISDPKLEELLNNGGLTFYWGTDPSADSLHIGHFASLLVAKRLKDAGHNPIILVGGATGLIGDPRPSAERPMITKELLNKNYECLNKQIKGIFDFEMVNNYDWSKDINFIDYLRDYGKYFSINYMLDKDTVKRRLDTGITYTEFSYMILQSLDFLWLFENKNCLLQIGGADQWGNLTAGIELIRKKTGKEVYSFTMPLITDSMGNKFGKSEGNAVWIDKNKTSSYEMYQFLINVEDEMVIDYLKKLTLLSKEKIEEIEKEHSNYPEKRIAHQRLAKEIITLLHGEEEYNKALKISTSLFTGEVNNLSDEEKEQAFKDVPNFEIKEDTTLIELLILNNIATSKREAREFLNNNAITIDGEVVTEEDYKIIKNKTYIIRKGKKKYYIFK